MRVLVVNTGSSSIKLSIIDQRDQVTDQVTLEIAEGRIDETALQETLDRLGPADAVGHRVVHGGSRFTGPVRIDAGVEDHLRSLVDLAPLHQAVALSAIELVRRSRPSLPAVACFDTAFHSTMPPAASTYAIPEAWRRDLGIRRFGFHGLSHAHAARRAAELLGAQDLALVSCHLGSGCSLAAIRSGCSIDTTMGFTPLEGLVMATRSGSIDPGIILWLQGHAGLEPGAIADALEHESGLKALAGTGDMRIVLAQAGAATAGAQLAFDIYVHRLRAGIAAMAASLGSLDALVFTGGVGENSAAVREAATRGLPFLGLEMDPELNGEDGQDRDISRAGAPARTVVIRAREDLQITREVRSTLR